MRRAACATLVAVLALGLAAAAPLAAQVVRGRVVDAATDQPVAGATVSALATGRDTLTARTAEDGTFEIELKDAGTFRLRAERLGYAPSTSAPVEVFSHETVEVDLHLSTTAVAVRPLVVRARSEQRVERLEDNGFYDRQKLGIGRFVTRRQIERQRPRDMSDVLRLHPGVRTLTDRSGRTHVLFSRAGGGCSPRIFMDGMPLGDRIPMAVDDLVQPVHVEAVEIYRGLSEIPARYQTHNNTCGVLVFWSRVGDDRSQESDEGSTPEET